MGLLCRQLPQQTSDGHNQATEGKVPLPSPAPRGKVWWRERGARSLSFSSDVTLKFNASLKCRMQALHLWKKCIFYINVHYEKLTQQVNFAGCPTLSWSILLLLVRPHPWSSLASFLPPHHYHTSFSESSISVFTLAVPPVSSSPFPTTFSFFYIETRLKKAPSDSAAPLAIFLRARGLGRF